MADKQTAYDLKRVAYKRWFDLSILVFAHLALLPLWIILWTIIPLLVWLGDRGPVFYRQKRVGKDGHIFTLLKFRTMVMGADRDGPAWTTAGDPRITRIGKLLRRTALDELPELLSIFAGDMSFVGPRALEVEEHKGMEERIPGFAERLNCLPGLTGLAQIYDRDDTASDKFGYDQEYLRRMGIWLDIRLILISVSYTLFARWDRRGGKPVLPVETHTSSDLGGLRKETPEKGPANSRDESG